MSCVSVMTWPQRSGRGLRRLCLSLNYTTCPIHHFEPKHCLLRHFLGLWGHGMWLMHDVSKINFWRHFYATFASRALPLCALVMHQALPVPICPPAREQKNQTIWLNPLPVTQSSISRHACARPLPELEIQKDRRVPDGQRIDLNIVLTFMLTSQNWLILPKLWCSFTFRENKQLFSWM